MKDRIVLWAKAGGFLAGIWAIYFAAISKDNPISPSVAMLSRLSCPIVFAGDYFHFGISMFWVLLSNIVTYAMAGLMVEALRLRLSHER